MKLEFLCAVFAYVINVCLCSVGNESPYFRKCTFNCLDSHCSDDGRSYRKFSFLNFFYSATHWPCESECEYECMWNTVYLFQERNYKIPQFYGKWPFIKFLTIQEPASTVFSLLNLYAHIKMLKKIKREVRPDSPFLWMWYLHAFICSHAWAWSAIFHARDTALTEFMDYSCAYSIVLYSFYTMLMRSLRCAKKIYLVILSVLCLFFYIVHTTYLYRGSFDYSYNMTVNILTGFLAVAGWLTFAFTNRNRLSHSWKIAVYVLLIAFTTLLELVDDPPMLWILDYHALWHLSTFPIAFIGYSFAIDDCKHLKKELELAKKDSIS